MDTINAEYVLDIPQVRKFLREFILESTGVDITQEIPCGRIYTEYEQGKQKIAIDLINYMIYNNPKSFKDLLNDCNKQEKTHNE